MHLQVDSEGSDQRVHSCMLIRVFTGCTCSLVGNAVPKLISSIIVIVLPLF